MAGRCTIIPRFTDDRGRVVDICPTHVFVRKAGARDGPWRERFDIHSDREWTIFGGGVIATLGAFIALGGRWWWLSIPTFALICWLVHAWFGGFLRGPLILVRGYAFIHQAVRLGRCPACAGVLDSAAETPDGMLECSECGAAWRGERRRTRAAPGDQNRRREIRASMRRLVRLDSRRPYIDHRGRPASLAVYRRSRVLASDYGYACHRAARAIFEEHSRRRERLVFGLLLSGFGMVVGMVQIGRLLALPLAWDYLILLVVVAFPFAILLVHTSDALVAPGTIERETLERGLCPACWELLSGIEPDPDGATPCPECGAAWRVPPPTRGPPLACPRCRYSLAGLPQEPAGVVTCPECGEVIVGVRPDEPTVAP